MKRTLAMVAVVLVGTLALTGCRARSGSAGGEPVKQPTATSDATQTKPAIAPEAAASKVSVDLSEVDAMLAELERQLAEADKSPADAD